MSIVAATTTVTEQTSHNLPRTKQCASANHLAHLPQQALLKFTLDGCCLHARRKTPSDTLFRYILASQVIDRSDAPFAPLSLGNEVEVVGDNERNHRMRRDTHVVSREPAIEA